METRQYTLLLRVALLLTIAWIIWSIYDGAIREKVKGDNEYYAANKLFEDGLYKQALLGYRKAVQENPSHIHAKRGIARSLMQLEEYEESLNMFTEVIEFKPNFAASYANRGILYDRMENYHAAIKDYRKALQLNPELADGPSWLTRFLRNQVQKPPTIAERLKYLQAELEKPEDQRVLSMPKVDDAQRPYKM